MPRVHKVERARKARPSAGIAVGDTYYYWTFRNRFGKGTRCFSKTYPKQSQLTRSEYLGRLVEIEERIEELTADATLEETVGEIAGSLRELGEEQEEKRNNMPESLQESDTGNLLQERAEACSNAADELEGIDFSAWVEDEDETATSRETDPDAEPINEDGQTEDEYWEAKLEEVQGVSVSG
jgi:hypothetical protein